MWALLVCYRLLLGPLFPVSSAAHYVQISVSPRLLTSLVAHRDSESLSPSLSSRHAPSRSPSLPRDLSAGEGHHQAIVKEGPGCPLSHPCFQLHRLR